MVETIYIHTSDRASFRRCRRRWAWTSRARGGLDFKESALPLWIGTGVHFALEDFHGHNYYGNPVDAFKAYTKATKATDELPLDWKEGFELATGMMNYYDEGWLSEGNRDPLKTFWEDDIPQVEVLFEIPLPMKGPDGENVIYRGTFDRVSIDRFGQLWIVEYKTAKAFKLHHFDLDAQTSAYCWAGSVLYDRPTVGVIYMQFHKSIPEGPIILASGKISANKQMRTTRTLYHRALVNLYGTVDKAPGPNIELLNSLAEKEDESRDIYVRRDIIERSTHQLEAEGTKILLEVEEMLNPNLALYNNPTNDCSWDCSLRDPCIMMDCGDDWETHLESITHKPEKGRDQWRKYLPPPQLPAEPPQQLQQ